ncbi:hypothetical protein [Rhodothermus marinus]|uniref:hypothetical protein n=1 Tax=Rhodothermus marinus TaxID=29549 RepID=UPI001FB381CC|nr:hypothetical protein [Rhodothermus marinus]
MVPPRDIGPFVTTEPKTPAQRRLTGRAIMPGEEAPRTVELFDARPALNRREGIITGETPASVFCASPGLRCSRTRPATHRSRCNSATPRRRSST